MNELPDILVFQMGKMTDVRGTIIDEVKASWPNAVVLESEDEIEIYRDAEAEKSWDDDAPLAEDNTMIHFGIDGNGLSIIVDNPKDPAMKTIIDNIIRGLDAKEA